MTYIEHITRIVKLNFKTSILKSSLCDYSDAYIRVSETITAGAEDAARAADRNKQAFIIKKLCTVY